ncbi:MAG TPA: GldG family protein [Polyangiales bacterium]|nr:GldG family protein [Polyangiales bacterium]
MSSEAKPLPGRKTTERERLLQHVAMNASTLFLVAIVLMLNYLAYRHYQRFDWTSQGVFTLSAKSKSVLKGLDKDVDVYVFMSQGEQSYDATDELLTRYRAASEHIKVHHVDPDREASEFKLLAQRFGIAASVIETGQALADVAAVVAVGDKNWHVSRDDLVSMDVGMPGAEDEQESVSIKAEQALTGAIVQVTSGRPTKLCTTKGHGEWALEEGNERSLATLKTALRHDNIEWQAFETLGQKSVPQGCDAVFVVGPLHAFSEAEANLLLDYVRGGGNLLLALDPVLEHDEVSATGFEAPLRDLGIRLDRALVLELDQERLLTRDPTNFVITEFGDHITTRPLQHAARVYLVLARGVAPAGNDPKVEILMRTSDKGFGETAIADVKGDEEPKRGPGDIEGPVSVAVATQVGKAGDDKATSKTGGRLIVVGDSDFLQGPLLETPELQNFYLASAWTGWLTERQALIEIPPKKIKTGNIVFSQEDLYSLLFRVGVLIPGAAFVLGFAVWLNRRQ